MSIKRIIGVILVYLFTCAAWLVLAGVTESRTHDQEWGLRQQVSSLWGEPQSQTAPRLKFRAVVPSTREVSESVVIPEEEIQLLALSYPPPKEEPDEKKKPALKAKEEAKKEPEPHWALRKNPVVVALGGSDVQAHLGSDPRRKGLVWYALYDVDFLANYQYTHSVPEAGYLDVEFALPTSDALYDGLIFEVNGQDRRASLDPSTGLFSVSVPVKPEESIQLRVAYKSRGSDTWNYMPGNGVEQLENFHLSLATDFRDIDFPERTVSPSLSHPSEDGWKLEWDFKSTITSHGMGMILPRHIQPGQLSTALTLSAPVSLLFFFLMIVVVATLQKLDIHPINYLFLGAAFFAFHLLFSYSADHLTVPWAFFASSVVSLVLVTSYLRLVVSPKFALRESALGQLVYLIGFSLAHFWEGFTGLTITVMAIITLFLLMQATGRLRWTEVLASGPNKPKAPPMPPRAEPSPAE